MTKLQTKTPAPPTGCRRRLFSAKGFIFSSTKNGFVPGRKRRTATLNGRINTFRKSAGERTASAAPELVAGSDMFDDFEGLIRFYDRDSVHLEGDFAQAQLILLARPLEMSIRQTISSRNGEQIYWLGK